MPGPYLSTGAFRTRVTANSASQEEEVGIWRFEGGKIYRYMRAGDLIPAGENVRMDFSVVTGSPGLIGGQVLQTSGPTNVFLGIAETTLASGNYGWITVYGPATARVATNQIPGGSLGPDVTATGVLSIRNTSHFMVGALALQTGLSAGSAVFVIGL